MDLLGFVEGSETAGTNLDLDRFAFAHQRLFVDVCEKLGLGVPVGVADVVTRHTGLETNLTAHRYYLVCCRPSSMLDSMVSLF